MALAVAVILLVIGTVAFHFLSPWRFTPIASNWDTMDRTVDVTFLVTGIVFVAVNLFMAYCIIRYRHRQHSRAHYEPENKKLEWWLIVVTTVGIAAMLGPGLSVWAKFVTVPDNIMVVEALGQQWNWAYRFPGADGQLGRTDIQLVSASNPLGIDPGDPQGQDDVVITDAELHLPLGKPVKVQLRSKDVNHQFAVPQFRVKMDMVPGMVTYFWLTPTRTGSFDVLCEQLCGVAHFTMRGRVVVDSVDEFQTWLARHPTFAQTRSDAGGDALKGKALYVVCSSCHGVTAQGNRELNAPKLAGQASWYLTAQLQAFRHGVRGADSDSIYAKQMAPFATSLADDNAVEDVVAYITTLAEQRTEQTVLGNPAHGKQIYATCATCHGANGEGIWSTNAPRLSNMSDWYLRRQLQAFQQDLRGTHPRDFNGAQMAAIAKAFAADPTALDDVVDHIHSL